MMIIVVVGKKNNLFILQSWNEHWGSLKTLWGDNHTLLQRISLSDAVLILLLNEPQMFLDLKSVKPQHIIIHIFQICEVSQKLIEMDL